MRGQPNDPAGWNEASYSHHPIDSIEPLETILSEKQIWKSEFMDVLRGVNQFMSKGKPSRKWSAVQIALGLFSPLGQTETAIAVQFGVTRAAVSKDVITVLKLTKLEHTPAFGLKSFKDRMTYKRTNGRRGVSKRPQPVCATV